MKALPAVRSDPQLPDRWAGFGERCQRDGNFVSKASPMPGQVETTIIMEDACQCSHVHDRKDCRKPKHAAATTTISNPIMQRGFQSVVSIWAIAEGVI